MNLLLIFWGTESFLSLTMGVRISHGRCYFLFLILIRSNIFMVILHITCFCLFPHSYPPPSLLIRLGVTFHLWKSPSIFLSCMLPFTAFLTTTFALWWSLFGFSEHRPMLMPMFILDTYKDLRESSCGRKHLVFVFLS